MLYFSLIFLHFVQLCLNMAIKMKVICAGYPKTGTKSMAYALRILGYEVHDLEEHYDYNLENYVDFLEGRVGAEIFFKMYKDVDAVTDVPACLLWNVILTQFPNAKVILMERSSSEAWYTSFRNMMKDLVYNHTPLDNSLRPFMPYLSRTYAMIGRLVRYSLSTVVNNEATVNEKFIKEMCPALCKDAYIRHNAAVKSLVPEKQLLVYQVGEGWEKLCEFLGKDAPDEDFPHENAGGSQESVQKKVGKFSVFEQVKKELCWSLFKIFATSVLIVLFGTFVFKRFSMS